MTDLMLDELDRVDQAFTGNRLLSTFAAEARGLIEPASTVVDLELDAYVLRRGEDVEVSLFPFESTMISMSVELTDGRSVEVASIGREGAVGGIISCGHAPAFSSAVVLVGGPALRVPIRVLEEAKRRSTFVANIFCRFSDCLLSQVMQSAVCNASHSIEQRAARWLLLAQDRAGDRIELTQAALAGLLGVQRTSVNGAIQSLQEGGLVESSRGAVRVVDRVGLKRCSCECYQAIEDHFGAVIGVTGSGSGAQS